MPLAAIIYIALTLVLTYPLIFQLGSVLPHDIGDPALNAWILWWNAHSLPFTQTWWNAPAFYPVRGTLAFSEHLLGLSVLSTPLQWIGFTPTVAYNIVFLLTFPLCGVAMYPLAHELTNRSDAAFIAGLLYAFAPYRIAQVPHIQVLAAYGMPLALFALHRFIGDGRRRWLLLFGASWLIQATSNGYYLLFFTLILMLWVLWFAPPWRNRGAFVSIATTWVVWSLPLVPLLWQYRVIHNRFHFARDFGAMVFFGADVAALLNAGRSLALWGWLHVFGRAEGELFPGVTIVLLLIAGAFLWRKSAAAAPASAPLRWTRLALLSIALVAGSISARLFAFGPWRFRWHRHVLFSAANPIKPLTYVLVVAIALILTSARVRTAYARRSAAGFYAVAAFVAWLLSLGPSPSLMGQEVMYRGPYLLVMHLPGFSSLRVPARFWMMSVLCLSVLAGMIFAELSRRSSRGRVWIAAIVSIAILSDGWVSAFPLVPVPPAWAVELCADATSSPGGIVEIPLGYVPDDTAAMYRSMRHRRPVVNGYSGYFPPHYSALRYGLNSHDPDMLNALAVTGTSFVIINDDNDRDGRWRRYISEYKGAKLICSQERKSLYQLSDISGERGLPAQTSIAWRDIQANVNPEMTGKMADGDLSTRWHSGPQSEGTTVVIDFGSTRPISAIELMLGRFYEDFARELVIESSDDAASWHQVWRGRSAPLAFRGAVESPSEVPVRYVLPQTRARYIRMRLLSNDEVYYWSIAELKVYE